VVDSKLEKVTHIEAPSPIYNREKRSVRVNFSPRSLQERIELNRRVRDEVELKVIRSA
jgi:hypothetical protein